MRVERPVSSCGGGYWGRGGGGSGGKCKPMGPSGTQGWRYLEKYLQDQIFVVINRSIKLSG